MPKVFEFTKNQIWGLQLIQAFFSAGYLGRLADFLTSDELRRFLHQAETGAFGGKVPDGTPGSKFPSTGGQSPIDVLNALFRQVGFGLGKVDRPGGGDPAAAEGVTVDSDGTRVTTHTDPVTGDRTIVTTYTDGEIRSETTHTNGTRDSFTFTPDGTYRSEHITGPGHYDRIVVQPGPSAGDCTVYTYQGRPGLAETGTRSVYPPGRQQSPGEDGGGEWNSDRNPLANLVAVGPQSMQQMVNQMQYPGRDSDKLDPNTGLSGVKLSKEEQERLGRIVPAAETLDPNSGVDPLSTLNLDPNQLHTRSEKDDPEKNEVEVQLKRKI